MPAILPLPLNIKQKHSILTIAIVLLPLFFFGQTLTGLWSGVTSQDSTTIRKDQSFEIALTEYKGKVYGYSCSEFIVNDTLYYIVKRVKGTIVGDLCEVTDDDIIAHNFPHKPDKGVKVTSTFRRNISDSAWYLDGTWKTNITKKYYAVTGKVGLKEEKDMAMSKLFPHLEELNLAKDVAFYQEKKETQKTMVVRVAKPESIKPTYTDRPTAVHTNTGTILVPSKPLVADVETSASYASVNKRGDDLKPAETKKIESGTVSIIPTTVALDQSKTDQAVVSINKQDMDLDRTETKKISSSSVNITPVEVNKSQSIQPGTVSIRKQEDITLAKTETKTVGTSAVEITPDAVNKSRAIANRPVSKTNNDVAANKVPVATKPIVKQDVPAKKDVAANPVTTAPSATKPVIDRSPEPVVAKINARSSEEIIQSSKPIEGRKSEFSQVVNFTSDSIELSLYDNGQIDGDTVSVYMDGQVLMSKQGLKSKAIKKTIYLPPGKDDFALVLFADNLGQYPPNTGLLVVHDGDDVYNLHFSSDMQKSTGIVFRRKPK